MELQWEYGMPELITMCLFKLKLLPPMKEELHRELLDGKRKKMLHEELLRKVIVTTQPEAFDVGKLTIVTHTYNEYKNWLVGKDKTIIKKKAIFWTRGGKEYTEECKRRNEIVSINWGQYHPKYICDNDTLLSRCSGNICRGMCSVCKEKVDMYSLYRCLVEKCSDTHQQEKILRAFATKISLI